MRTIEDRIAAVVETHQPEPPDCSCPGGHGWCSCERVAKWSPAHVAAAVVAELQLTDETQFIHPFGYGEAVERRWVTQWEKDA